MPDGAVTHGRVAVIVPVKRGAGTAALKVSFPHPGNVHEPDGLAAWGGRGAVRLHERDDARFAMLLERARTATLAEAAELDRDRVRRWAQLHAVQAAFHGRRHGFGIARGGPWLERFTALADRLAESLTGPAESCRGR